MNGIDPDHYNELINLHARCSVDGSVRLEIYNIASILCSEFPDNFGMYLGDGVSGYENTEIRRGRFIH